MSEIGLIGRKEACRRFRISLRRWSEWQKAGRVKGIRIGKHRFYTDEELSRLAEEIRRSTEPYPDEERPGCWRVPVSSRQHRLEALVDADSLPLIAGKRWN